MSQFMRWLWNRPDTFGTRLAIIGGVFAIQATLILVGGLTWRFAREVCR